MDHLCGLPNDAARRKALKALPPTLHATYERILQRVNKCGKEVQQLVQRSLRWLLCSKEQLTSLALCEAVSIESGDTTLDWSAVPDEEEILRRCSSLVRRSASGESIELAHFTVKEFLTTGVDPEKEYGLYHFCSETDEVEAAQVCLTYLNFEEFGSGNRDSMDFSYKRFELFAFREYAVYYWAEHAREYLDDQEVLSLTQQLLHPSKPLSFVSWTQDLLWTHNKHKDTASNRRHECSMTDVMTMSPLHFAALLALPESCAWLLQNGCNVDQTSACGTPLECALVGYDAFEDELTYSQMDETEEFHLSRSYTVKMIIDSGADVQKSCLRGPSYLSVALSLFDQDSSIELLRKGAIIDSESAEWLADSENAFLAHGIFEGLSEDEIRPEDRTTLLKAALRDDELLENPSLERLGNRSGDYRAVHIDYLSPFLIAAEYGQLSVLEQLFRDHKLHVDAIDHSGQRSALHLSASNDHIKIVEFLHEHGADHNLLDSQGRTPLHASVEKPGRYLCLQFLLKENVDIHSTDDDGLTAWHLAAQQGNAHALSILQESIPENQMCPHLKDNEGRTPLHYAAQSGSKETLKFLLDHIDKEAVHDKSIDGLTALHYGVDVCSLDTTDDDENFIALEVLLENGADPSMEDLMGSTVLVNLVKIWEKFFLRLKARNDTYFEVPVRFVRLFSKILTSTEDKTFLSTVCKDPHLLCLALIFGETALAEETLGYSPSMDMTAHRILQLNPLQAACYYGRCSRSLLEELHGRSKAERGSGGAVTGLLLFACEGEGPAWRMKRVVTDLLDLGSDPNERSAEGKTAMMLAAKGGHVAVVNMLIDHGANVSITDNNGWSVTHYACQSGSGELLHSLKSIATDWDAKIAARLFNQWSYNATALHLAACLRGNALRFLLTNDLLTDINSLTQDKETALWMAALFGISKNVSLLLDEGADATIRDSHLEAPLHAAIRCGNLEVVEAFIDKGCDPSLQDGSGLTPELIARKHGHLDIAELLKERISAGGMNERIC